MTEDPRIDPADLRNVRFPGSSRRYDARSVDQFLETVAARIAATNALVDELQARLAEIDGAAPVAAPVPPAPELGLLDDDELVKLVGEETASVLSTARRAAEEIRTKAEESAARMIREATSEADRLTDEAKATATALTSQAEQALEQATAQATADAERIRAEAAAEAERTTAEAVVLVESERAALDERRAEAEAEAERILEEARAEGRGMVNEAKEVRTRILDDLQRRRDTARDQIERLLAGRERLLGAYQLVRENLDDITGQLADALPEAGEPELPDGFVGIVGSSAPVAPDDDGGETAAVDVEAEEPPVAAEPDDTVAPEPISETEADIRGVDEDVDVLDGGDGPGADEAGVEPQGAAGTDPQPDAEADTEVDAGGGDEVAVDAAPADGGEADGAETDGAGTGGADEPAVQDEAGEAGDTGVDDQAEAVEAPAEADPDEPSELDADEAASRTAAPGGDVDELFARLRAEREASVAKARQVVEADDAPTGAPEDESDPPSAPAPVEEPLAVEDEPAEAPEAADESTGDVDRIPAEFLADDAALTARSEALAPLDVELNRALKRRLADEQNELLDLLRRSGTTTAADLLPELSDQIGGYARLAEKHLLAAAVAGGQAAGGDVGGDVGVAELATALGATLVEPFRRRVERSASEVAGDPDELDERLRALYREWKVQHVGPAADDALLSAYALGTLAAAEPDGPVRWRIDPTQGPCPDAQDNALAGEVVAGEAFPTGDACPQAHPGCRCLLVRA